jgi:hypothetical protein
VPEDLACDTEAGQCSQDFPLGDCEGDATCVDGQCLTDGRSARCKFNLSTESGAAQMVERGRLLAQRYDASLEAYYADDGSSSARELRLFRQFSRAQYDMESHIEKLNNIRAVFDIYGKVY